MTMDGHGLSVGKAFKTAQCAGTCELTSGLLRSFCLIDNQQWKETSSAMSIWSPILGFACFLVSLEMGRFHK